MTTAKTFNQQILYPGDLVYSVCGGFVYEICSHAVCRIYYDYSENAKFLLSYHEMEGLSHQDRQRGLKYPHVSYLAKIHNSTLLSNGLSNVFYLTDTGLKLIKNIYSQPRFNTIF